MKLTFVRHGDTKENFDEIVQAPDNPLSDAGREQAKLVGVELINFNIDTLLTSPLPRAVETAKLINVTLNLDMQVNELLKEVKWPSVLEGKKTSSPEVMEYKKLRNENNSSETSWHYADEENFLDLKKRARSLLTEIESLPGENVLAVSHSTFMKVMVMVMCHGESVSWQTYFDFLVFTRPRHTSISTFKLDSEGKWHLETWNMRFS